MHANMQAEIQLKNKNLKNFLGMKKARTKHIVLYELLEL